jgi:23S rRNA (cytidine2498-2'-O)-methyltransferase
VHVFERDFHPPGEEPPGFTAGAEADAWLARLRDDPRLAGLRWNEEPGPGELVLDVTVVEPGPGTGDDGELWFGAHAHGPAHPPWPGGNPRLALPADAPSRAWLKLEEGLRWAGLPVRPGDTAVEIGSAPGGASWALLQRGVKVVGIDPGAMDPRVLKHPCFLHIARPVATVPREELPDPVHWLLLDMNVAPHVSLFAVDRLASRMRDGLLGLLLTVKLNQWKMAAEIPSWLEHVRVMGMSRVRATQLPSNRQEICIAGLTRKGLMRTG